MPRHRSHSLEFKRQIVEEYLGGETLHGLDKRHDIYGTIARVLFCFHQGEHYALYGFIKKSQTTPAADLELA